MPNKTETSNDAKKEASTEIKKEKQKEFDFESEGIPQEKVEIRALGDPCKAISTMQITRDLRNDTSHNLSALLSSIPTGVLEACKASIEKKEDIDVQKIPTIPDDVLDLDIAAALANVKVHREVVKKQREHRQKCIELLIKSRCQFGSVEAASLFYDLEGVRETLKKRKAQILDAMELEGLDFEAIGGGEDGDKADTFEDFAWLSREDASAAKKMRAE